MKRNLKTLLALSGLVLAGHAAAQITFYEGEGFRGRAFTTNERVWNLERNGFNDRASSIVIDRGRWEVCEHARFEGRCMVLRRGSYPSLREMGMNNVISSVRPAESGRRYSNEAPEPLAAVPDYEYRRRANERVFDAPITSVRAVVGPPNQRCWVERQQVTQPSRGDANVGGAVVGGLIGGILGHQVGGGSGKDLATAGGAVAGAVIGSNQGRNGGPVVVDRDVQRCQTVQNTQPDYWDVTYNHRGVEHHVQMSAPPVGRTIAVNGNGDPRQ
ncbi:MAG: hypothetical protein JWP43_753 [Ramlibacter sp.]|jgi:uncharacterized protein YcfJ|nr:hypothetical protein [Ramlibacter sp.]